MSSHKGLVAVGVMAVSHRLRNFVGLISLLFFVLGLVLIPLYADTPAASFPAVFLVPGIVGLFFFVVALFLSWIGRIIGEDSGLIDRND